MDRQSKVPVKAWAADLELIAGRAEQVPRNAEESLSRLTASVRLLAERIRAYIEREADR